MLNFTQKVTPNCYPSSYFTLTHSFVSQIQSFINSSSPPDDVVPFKPNYFSWSQELDQKRVNYPERSCQCPDKASGGDHTKKEQLTIPLDRVE